MREHPLLSLQPGDEAYDLAVRVGTELRDAGATLAVAESCTGGGLGFALTAVPGSSDYFIGGIVAYANAVKVAPLGVRQETLDSFGAVSPETAREMAVAARGRLGATYGVSITGIAGPGGSDGKPEGLVYIACASPADTAIEEHHFADGRSAIRGQSILAALRLALRVIRD